MNFGPPQTMDGMLATDPTIDTDIPPDQANGPTPSPPIRYGEPLSKSWVPLYRKPMRTPTRPLRIITIGAGISAMNLAYKIYHEHDLINAGIVEDLVMYEAHDELGGTWLVNLYPGVACDVPAHIYTFPWAPNPEWSAYYASGGEIWEYFMKVVKQYDLARGVKTSHRVQKAEWDEAEGKWRVEILNSKTGEVVKDECDVLVSATGFLSNWKWPDIPGLQDFNGTLCHSAAWDSSFDETGKRVAVIGNGSSAIQILPQLVDKASHVSNFIRRPTYITPGLGSAMIGGKEQHVYSEEEKQNFRDNPEALTSYRKKIQAGSNRAFDMFTKDSEAQRQGKKATADQMREKLNHNEDLAQKLIPDYEVGCRRATPGPGYLTAFTRDNVSLITDPITAIEATGIRTKDNTLHEYDAIICATGFNVSHRPPWPLLGQKGVSLADHWTPEPSSYLSLCTDKFPNLFFFSGPNAPVGHGSLMAGLGYTADYICNWIRKIAEEDIKFAVVKEEVVQEFAAYQDEIMQTLVWSGGCHSWYKNHRVDGRVTAVWGGSALGFMEMVGSGIRGEDFEVGYRTRNRFRFMGNGRTKLEYDPFADLAYYLKK